LSTEQPLHAEALRTLQRYVKQRSQGQRPWLVLNERGDQFTRSAIHDLVGSTGVRAGLTFHVYPHLRSHGCGYALANRGYALRLIQDYLGHRDPTHTTRYPRTATHRFEGLWE
jgi:type 1 fimbriae regulatory protein FimB